jgi:hypothetical protein
MKWGTNGSTKGMIKGSNFKHSPFRRDSIDLNLREYKKSKNKMTKSISQSCTVLGGEGVERGQMPPLSLQNFTLSQ